MARCTNSIAAWLSARMEVVGLLEQAYKQRELRREAQEPELEAALSKASIIEIKNPLVSHREISCYFSIGPIYTTTPEQSHSLP
jgi:hypothetical protein